jgi:hypothetical protein
MCWYSTPPRRDLLRYLRFLEVWFVLGVYLEIVYCWATRIENDNGLSISRRCAKSKKQDQGAVKPGLWRIVSSINDYRSALCLHRYTIEVDVSWGLWKRYSPSIAADPLSDFPRVYCMSYMVHSGARS